MGAGAVTVSAERPFAFQALQEASHRDSFHWACFVVGCCFFLHSKEHSAAISTMSNSISGWSVHGGRGAEKMLRNPGTALGEEQLHQSASQVSHHGNYISLPLSPTYLIQGQRGSMRSPLSSHVTSDYIHSAFLFN